MIVFALQTPDAGEPLCLLNVVAITIQSGTKRVTCALTFLIMFLIKFNAKNIRHILALRFENFTLQYTENRKENENQFSLFLSR